MMPRYGVDLLPARPGDVPRDALPMLPRWWPLDPIDGPRLSEQERDTARHNRAMREACAGPFDGHRGIVIELPAGQAPPSTFSPRGYPEVVYKLDGTTGSRLRYRYSPRDSRVHPEFMAAVTEAFLEAGPRYAEGAREGGRR